jgi:hypothetical protein
MEMAHFYIDDLLIKTGDSSIVILAGWFGTFFAYIGNTHPNSGLLQAS